MFSKFPSLLLLVVLFIFLCPGSTFAAEPLAYYSDYFSFVGKDENGYLLFAFDNNRGVDGQDYQAEHFGVLYDQFLGWINLVGLGAYKNTDRVLDKIPNSSAFQFTGHPSSGITVLSRANDLRLEVNPVSILMTDKRTNLDQSWGDAAAVLYWQGRTIPGRVIYEGLVHRNWNRITRRYTDTWDNFQGFYLSAKIGVPSAWQDIYLRSEGLNERQRTRGFIDAGSKQASITTSDFLVTKRGWAVGFYRWNKAWQMSLQQVQPNGIIVPPFARLELNQVSRQNVSNWVIGGFAMSVVEGTLEVNGHKIEILGFAELIK